MKNEKRLIDANALLQKVEKCTASKVIKALTFIFVQDAPTVDAVEVVHGRWETHNQVDSVFYCSVCKLNVSNFEKRWLNYCPNCGAKMDKKLPIHHGNTPPSTKEEAMKRYSAYWGERKDNG